MSQLNDQLTLIQNARDNMKTALEEKGQTVSKDIRTYAEAIDNISSGIDTSDATATADDILNPKTAYVNGQKITGNITNTSTIIDGQMLTYNLTLSSTLYAMTKDRSYLFLCNGSNTITVYKKGADSNEYTQIYSITATELGITIGPYLFCVGCWGLFGDNNKCLIILKNSSYNSNSYGLVFDKSTETITKPYTYTFGGFNAYGWAISHPTQPNIVAHNKGIFKYNTTGVTTIANNDYGISNGIKQWSCNGNLFVYFNVSNDSSRFITISDSGTNIKNQAITGVLVPNKAGNYAFKDGKLVSFAFDKNTGTYSTGVLTYDLTLDTKYCIWYADDIVACITNPTVSENNYYTIKIYKIDFTNGTKTLIYTTADIQNHDNSFAGQGSGDLYSGFISRSSGNVFSIFYMAEGEQILTSLTYKNNTFYSPYDTTGAANELLAGKILYGTNGKIIGTMPNNGQLNYTPTASQQTIPAGYTTGGTIGAVTSAIDSNIQAENIKKDISILGVTGTYEGEGGQTLDEKDVNFRDYDGVLTASYTAQEFANLTELPQLPTHSGLIAQGWNWALADAKIYVATCGKLEIGPMYITDDDSTRFYVTLTEGFLEPYLCFGLKGTVTIDWGDGSATETITGTSYYTEKINLHSYSEPGSYIIKIIPNTNDYTGISISGANGSQGKYILRRNSEYEYPTYNHIIDKIELGKGVNFESGCFYDCRNMKTITFPNNLLSGFAQRMFYNCSKLQYTSIPIISGVTQLPNDVFYRGYNIEHISIPASVTSFGSGCFAACSRLRCLNLPLNFTASGNLFSEANGLEEVTGSCAGTTTNNLFASANVIRKLPSFPNLTTIGNNAFSSCGLLRDEDLPLTSNITTIGQRAFNGCTEIVNLSFPLQVTTITNQVAGYCYNLTNVEFKGDITTIESYAFSNSNSIKILNFSNNTTVPTLDNTNALPSNSFYKIVVPDDLYEEWIATAPWDTIQTHIIRVSDI